MPVGVASEAGLEADAQPLGVEKRGCEVETQYYCLQTLDGEGLCNDLPCIIHQSIDIHPFIVLYRYDIINL